MRFGPDLVLELCAVIGTLAGVVVGYFSGWLFPCVAAGLAAGLVIGAKLNPDTGDSAR